MKFSYVPIVTPLGFDLVLFRANLGQYITSLTSFSNFLSTDNKVSNLFGISSTNICSDTNKCNGKLHAMVNILESTITVDRRLSWTDNMKNFLGNVCNVLEHDLNSSSLNKNFQDAFCYILDCIFFNTALSKMNNDFINSFTDIFLKNNCDNAEISFDEFFSDFTHGVYNNTNSNTKIKKNTKLYFELYRQIVIIYKLAFELEKNYYSKNIFNTKTYEQFINNHYAHAEDTTGYLTEWPFKKVYNIIERSHKVSNSYKNNLLLEYEREVLTKNTKNKLFNSDTLKYYNNHTLSIASLYNNFNNIIFNSVRNRIFDKTKLKASKILDKFMKNKRVPSLKKSIITNKLDEKLVEELIPFYISISKIFTVLPQLSEIELKNAIAAFKDKELLLNFVYTINKLLDVLHNITVAYTNNYEILLIGINYFLENILTDCSKLYFEVAKTERYSLIRAFVYLFKHFNYIIEDEIKNINTYQSKKEIQNIVPIISLYANAKCNIIISIRGTITLLEWLLNFETWLYPDNILPSNKIHKSVSTIISPILPIIYDDINEINTLYNCNGNLKIIITGHSLGASIGHQLSMSLKYMLKNEKIKIGAVLFSPFSHLGSNFNTEYEKNIKIIKFLSDGDPLYYIPCKKMIRCNNLYTSGYGIDHYRIDDNRNVIDAKYTTTYTNTNADLYELIAQSFLPLSIYKALPDRTRIITEHLCTAACEMKYDCLNSNICSDCSKILTSRYK